MTLLGEVVTALVTPFDENNNVDFEQVEKLSKYLIENGSDSILVSGTTGESPTLSCEEVKNLIATVKSAVGSRCKILVGAGTNNTEKSLKLAQEALKNGADAILSVVPYYNKPSQDGMKAHFAYVAKNINAPIVMYNIPGRTGVNMLPSTITSIAKEYSNIIAVKQSNPDMDQITEIVDSSPTGFVVYSGDDSLTLPMLSLGAYGVISVASHVIGSKIKEMITSYKAGNVSDARDVHMQCYPVFKKIFIAPNPTPIKYAMKKVGLLKNDLVRLPLVSINENERSVIDQMVADAYNLIPANAK